MIWCVPVVIRGYLPVLSEDIKKGPSAPKFAYHGNSWPKRLFFTQFHPFARRRPFQANNIKHRIYPIMVPTYQRFGFKEKNAISGDLVGEHRPSNPKNGMGVNTCISSVSEFVVGTS